MMMLTMFLYNVNYVFLGQINIFWFLIPDMGVQDRLPVTTCVGSSTSPGTTPDRKDQRLSKIDWQIRVKEIAKVSK